jgi:tRNA/tmRNA/rRNA uracil-C5-methylase (TrmA/RlmC/RlmD family)
MSTENSAHGYSEGSEVPKEKPKRISKDQRWLAYIIQIRNKHDEQLQSLRDQLVTKDKDIELYKRVSEVRETKIQEWIEHDKKLKQELAAKEEESRKLKEWKESEIQVWGPVIDYCQKNHERLGIKLGTSISAFILRCLKHIVPIKPQL